VAYLPSEVAKLVHFAFGNIITTEVPAGCRWLVLAVAVIFHFTYDLCLSYQKYQKIKKRL